VLLVLLKVALSKTLANTASVFGCDLPNFGNSELPRHRYEGPNDYVKTSAYESRSS
jgi:hypothetical protein